MPGPGLLFWLRLAEGHITLWLLRRPMFHRFVETLHKQVHRIKHGTPPEEMGGRNIDKPRLSESLFKHFKEEVQDQFRDMTGRGHGKRPPPKR